jgi:WD40 repeat protein
MLRSHLQLARAASVAAALAAGGCALGLDDLGDLDEEDRALATATQELGAGFCLPTSTFAPGVVSTDADEGRVAISTDGKTLYFHRFLPEQNRITIFESHRQGLGWSPAVEFPLAGYWNDLDPFLSVDGKRIYFSSDRPIDGGTEVRPDWEIWYAARTAGGGWGAPQHLGPEVNTPANELFPSTTLDGALYFNSDREGGMGAWDIYRAPRRGSGFAAAANLGPGINTEHWEFNPAPSPGGHFIVFGSIGRPDNLGGSDLYASVKLGPAWEEAWNLGPCVNTAADEYHPTLSLHRASLIFVRFSDVTQGDLLEIGLGLP